MTAHEHPDLGRPDPDNAELLSLLADLVLSNDTPPNSPVPLPRTPSPRVSSSSVRAFHLGGSKKKPRAKKAAYVVFCGKQCGVFLTWAETEKLVSGVRHSIFRGYRSQSEASAAFAYAQARSWTRVSDAPLVVSIPALPQPIEDRVPSLLPNPLNGSEALNGQWYIVYRGICPGVYRSHLESQLNTLGVRGSLHESIEGRASAIQKFDAATRRGDVRVIPPTYYPVGADPFV
ncbi:hypothetical protein DFH09DRAFT_1102052 [Mycena vulgaris]|nr:hypothetical protein DFH09DRAFT_1102052 [Mycena vulgaris]